MSNIRSRPLPPADALPGPRSAAVFRRAAFTRQRRGVRRAIGGILMVLSLAGTLLYGGGGVDAWRQLTPLWIGVLAAAVWQAVATYGQWVFGGADWWNPWYILSLIASVVPTVLGYWPLVYGRLTALIVAWTGADTFAGAYAWLIAGAIIVVVAVALDMLPERELLD